MIIKIKETKKWNNRIIIVNIIKIFKKVLDMRMHGNSIWINNFKKKKCKKINKKIEWKIKITHSLQILIILYMLQVSFSDYLQFHIQYTFFGKFYLKKKKANPVNICNTKERLKLLLECRLIRYCIQANL